jgi:zinc finger protein 830
MNVAREKEAEKRKREAEEVMEEDEQGPEEEVEEVASKKPRLEAQPEPTGNFPADFFSDPSRKLPSASQSDDEDDAEEAPASKAAPMTLDEEYALFTEAVVNTSHQEIYQAATISAEAQLAEETPEGFPTQQQEEVVEKVEEETEEQKRLRLKQEEHELIMDRIIEEERAQEEADMKVATMKAKLEALRQKRLKKTQS